jgi:hypothetical protein
LITVAVQSWCWVSTSAPWESRLLAASAVLARRGEPTDGGGQVRRRGLGVGHLHRLVSQLHLPNGVSTGRGHMTMLAHSPPYTCWLQLKTPRVTPSPPSRCKVQEGFAGLASLGATILNWAPLGSVAYPGEVVSLDGLRLRVRSLDAVDSTPIIDVKPRLHTVDPFNEDRP